jgi:hypothetical protein
MARSGLSLVCRQLEAGSRANVLSNPSLGSGLSLSDGLWPDVLVEPEHVGRVVFGLDLD